MDSEDRFGLIFFGMILLFFLILVLIGALAARSEQPEISFDTPDTTYARMIRVIDGGILPDSCTIDSVIVRVDTLSFYDAHAAHNVIYESRCRNPWLELLLGVKCEYRWHCLSCDKAEKWHEIKMEKEER